MRKLRRKQFLPAALAVMFLGAVAPVTGQPAGTVPAPTTARLPRLFPDYTGIVLPPNIAPLNFRVEEPGQRYRLEVRSLAGAPLRLESAGATVRMPPKAWGSLLRRNAGGPLYFDVAVQGRQGRWESFLTVTNTIAREEIDQFLVYRRLGPLFNLYMDIGLYQRDLGSWAEKALLRNTAFDRGCLNCHTFLRNGPEPMVLQIREKALGNPMLLVRSNEVFRVATTGGYTAWHPSGRLLVFSANKLSMFFHSIGETRDVFDAESNLRLYRLDSNAVVTPPAVARPDRQETWPAWSPDGRHLYFCSAPGLPPEQFRQVRYDLQRVAYDLEHDTWGEVETLVAAAQTGLSAAQPRVSPDGKWLVFCLYDYGNFPVYRASSDLYVMDLSTRQMRRLEINSDQVESWHGWSRNSRWLVFSSKRLDRLFSRPFFSYVDEQGAFHKPFLLPQKDPAFYDTDLKNYNLPELIHEPFRLEPGALARALTKSATVLTPRVESKAGSRDAQSASEATGGQPEYQRGGPPR